MFVGFKFNTLKIQVIDCLNPLKNSDFQFSDSYFCSVKSGVAKTCFAGVDGVLVLVIEVASTLFTHGPQCWLQAFLAIF